MRGSGEEKQKHKSMNAGFSNSFVNCDRKKFEKFCLPLQHHGDLTTQAAHFSFTLKKTFPQPVLSSAIARSCVQLSRRAALHEDPVTHLFLVAMGGKL